LEQTGKKIQEEREKKNVGVELSNIGVQQYGANIVKPS